MTELRRKVITPDDSFGIDAFSRWRVSNPVTVFDSKQLYDDLPLLWDDAQTSGSGTSSSHSTNTASTTLSVGASTAGTRVRQTFRRFSYNMGNSQRILLSSVLGSGVSDITRRVGLFDDDNGLFFELVGTTLNVVRRTYTSGSAVDNTVAQSAWNIDKLDGTGDSGITLDTSKANSFIIDFQWSGTGRVRFGVIIDGTVTYCHELNNANTLTTAYMSTPNLPLRYEISNGGTGVASSLEHICDAVVSEGGNAVAIPRSVSRGTSFLSTQSDTDIYPLLSLRLKSTHLSASIVPKIVSVLCNTTADFEVFLILNPTVAGTDAVSWTSLTNACVEYDVSRDNTNKLTSGTVLFGGSGSNTNKVELSAGEESILLGSTISGTRDELVIGVRNLASAVEDYHAVINFGELA